MSYQFNLPGSSFEEIQKIVRAYCHVAEATGLDQIAKLTGLHTTIVSRNHKFLVDIGLISGGMKKAATELGRKLGRALDHKQDHHIQEYWRESVQSNPDFLGLLTTVRIRGAMSETEFTGHVLYVSGKPNNPGNKAGARCLVDILFAAKLLNEVDGNLTVLNSSLTTEESAPVDQFRTPPTVPSPFAVEVSEPSSTSIINSEGGIKTVKAVATKGVGDSALTSSIILNIHLTLPATDDPNVYHALFKAMRDNFLLSC